MSQIRASGVFGKSQRRATLLEHLIRSEVNGEGDRLKAYSIGLDVLGRGEDFDPSTDSIVRVEVGRLRDALALFDAGEYSVGQIRVQIPKGTYRPTFSERPRLQPKLEPGLGNASPARINWAGFSLIFLLGFVMAIGAGAWLWIDNNSAVPSKVKSIRLLLSQPTSEMENGTSNRVEPVRRFFMGLRQALTKNRVLAVMVMPPVDDRTQIDYRLWVDSFGREQLNRITLELVEVSSGSIVWAESFDVHKGGSDEEIDAAVVVAAREILPRIVISSKDALSERDVETLNAWELYRLSTWDPGFTVSSLAWQLERIKLAERALVLDPNLSEAHSVLADKLSYLSSMLPHYYTDEIIEASRFHAAKSLEHRPHSIGTLFNVSVHFWHLGEIQKAMETGRRVLEIDPNNGGAQFLSVLGPYTCVPAPENVVQFAIDFDQQLSLESPLRGVVLSWLATMYLNRGEIELAEKTHAQSQFLFSTPGSVLQHAALLHALGRTAEAIERFNTQNQAWPGLSPEHFAKVTIPRRCHEFPEAGAILRLYSDFADAYRQQL